MEGAGVRWRRNVIHWLVKGFLAWFFFAALPDGLALLATLVLLYPWSDNSNRRREEQRNQHIQELARFVELHTAIEQHQAKGEMGEEDYRRIRDALLRRYPSLLDHFTGGQTRTERLEQAWSLLTGNRTDFGTPPWLPRPVPDQDAETTTAVEPEAVPVARSAALIPDAAMPAIVPAADPVDEPRVIPAIPPNVISKTKPAARSPGVWRQRGARLSKAFREMALPFLWQNIGWFIGGFFLVSGSAFLVRYSEGFFKGLAVFASLAVFSLLFTWGGYQIRKHRAEQAMSSNVLLIIGVLLVPPSLAAGSRLLVDSGNSPVFLVAGSIFLLLAIAVFFFSVRLSDGLMERRLPAPHARLFMQLALIQCLLPLTEMLGHWSVVAATDAALLGILAFGVVRHGRDWIKEIFLERRTTTYYAVGSLIFAAVVSFSHVHWASAATMPRGYFGVFVLALSLLLLIADVQLKHRISDSAWAGRLTFIIYGLSVAGVLLAWGSDASVPATASAFTLTLALAAGLYGEMMRRYLSVAPFYLLAASMCALYAMLVLVHLPPRWHFLGGLPALLLLWRIYRFAAGRERLALPRVALRLTLSLGGLLLAWSLTQGASAAAFISALAGAVLVRVVLDKVHSKASDWNEPMQKAAGYLQNALVAVSFALAPAIGDTSQVVVLSAALLGLGVVWGLAGWHYLPRARERATVMVDSALLAIGTGTAVSLLAYPGYTPLVVAYLAAAVLLLMALAMRLPSLVYASMAAGVLGYGLYKFAYGLSTHEGSVFIGVPLLWLGVRVLAIWAAPFSAIASRSTRSVRVLGRLELRQYSGPRPGVLLQPLTHGLWALWMVGLGRLGMEAGTAITTAWGMHAISLGAVALMLAAGNAVRWLFSIAFVLAFAGWGAFFNGPWITLATGSAALMIWLFARAAASRQIRFWRVLGWRISPEQLQQWVREHVIVTQIATAMAVVFFLLQPGAPVPVLLGAALSSMVFFAAAGVHRQKTSYSYCLLAVLFAVGWATYGQLGHLGLDELFSVRSLSAVFPWLALAGGLLFLALSGSAGWRSLYALPVRNSAALLFVIGLGATFETLRRYPAQGAHLSLSFGLLAAAAALLPHGLRLAPRLRGAGVPVLLSAAFLSSGGNGSLPDHWLLSIWGFALWATGCFLLPHLNRRWPNWRISPIAWPIIGLTFATAGFAVATAEEGLHVMHVAVFTAYLLALYGSVAWAWLAVAVANALLLLVPTALLEVFPDPLSPSYLIAALLWLNLLLGLFPFMSRRPRLWWWNIESLRGPLKVSIAAVLSAGLAYMVGETVDAWRGHASGDLIGMVPMVLLPLTWMHLLGRTQTEYAAHGTLLGLADVYLALTGHLISLPFGLATFFVWLSLAGFLPSRSKSWTMLKRAAVRWSPVTFATAAAVLALYWGAYDPADYVAMFAVSTGAFIAARGATRASTERAWLGAGKIAMLISMHLPWLHWVAPHAWPALLPWWALQNILLSLTIDSTPVVSLRKRLFPEGRRSWAFPLLLSLLGLSQLALHGVWLLANGGPAFAMGIAGQLAGSAAVALWCGQVVYAGRARGESWVYLMTLAVALTLGYLRMLWFGPAAMTVWDTAGLIAASFLAMIVHRATGSQALYRVSLLLPALALLTVPVQLESLHASMTLLAMGSFYLVSHWKNEAKLPLYLGLLAINVGTYLWVPGIAHNMQLFQLYTVPAAITVLAMLQLHALELKPSVRHATRLGALSVLYASAALDLFLEPGMGVFALALALSLGGVVLGLALQIRAFLYSGTVFLILVVAGQLFMNYPEGNLAKGALLMAGGAGITGAMIWMNIKREALLQRLQALRAELAEWE